MAHRSPIVSRPSGGLELGRSERLLIAWAVLIFVGCGDGGRGATTAGVVDIGGGRMMYREGRGIGTPIVVLVSGKGNRADILSARLAPTKPSPKLFRA